MSYPLPPSRKAGPQPDARTWLPSGPTPSAMVPAHVQTQSLRFIATSTLLGVEVQLVCQPACADDEDAAKQGTTRATRQSYHGVIVHQDLCLRPKMIIILRHALCSAHASSPMCANRTNMHALGPTPTGSQACKYSLTMSTSAGLSTPDIPTQMPATASTSKPAAARAPAAMRCAGSDHWVCRDPTQRRL